MVSPSTAISPPANTSFFAISVRGHFDIKASRRSVIVQGRRRRNRDTRRQQTLEAPESESESVNKQDSVKPNSATAPTVGSPSGNLETVANPSGFEQKLSSLKSAPSKVNVDKPAPRAAASPPELPRVEREQVLGACFNTSLALGTAGIIGRQFSDFAATRGWFGGSIASWSEALPLPTRVDPAHLGLAAAAAGAVSVARVVLLSQWAEFKAATDASNRQVLSPLTEATDLVQVSLFPAAGEELLFRGLLLPAVGMNIAGVLVSACVFGALHIPGGRNPAFGVWASMVGCMYAGLALYTKDLSTPIVAHTLANLASAAYWRSIEFNK